MQYKPLYDKIILEMMPSQEVKTETGFRFTQDMSSNKYTLMEAKVVACGEGRVLQNGDILPMTIKVGDIVKYSKMQGESFFDGEKEYTIISESNILAYSREEV